MPARLRGAAVAVEFNSASCTLVFITPPGPDFFGHNQCRSFSALPSCLLWVSRHDALSPHIGLQNFWNEHTSTRLLIFFKNRKQSAPNRQTAPVQCVHELGFALSFPPKANIGATRLESLKI